MGQLTDLKITLLTKRIMYLSPISSKMKYLLSAFWIVGALFFSTIAKGQGMPEVIDNSVVEIKYFEFLGAPAIRLMEESHTDQRVFKVVLQNNSGITMDYLTCQMRIYSNDSFDELLYLLELKAPVAMRSGQGMIFNCRVPYSEEAIRVLKNLAQKFPADNSAYLTISDVTFSNGVRYKDLLKVKE